MQTELELWKRYIQCFQICKLLPQTKVFSIQLPLLLLLCLQHGRRWVDALEFVICNCLLLLCKNAATEGIPEFPPWYPARPEIRNVENPGSLSGLIHQTIGWFLDLYSSSDRTHFQTGTHWSKVARKSTESGEASAKARTAGWKLAGSKVKVIADKVEDGDAEFLNTWKEFSDTGTESSLLILPWIHS